jgi:uncharacterized pyridoxal phosphate-dependent enzyme
MKRRQLLKSFTILPLSTAAGTMLSSNTALAAGNPANDLFKELGLRTFINAAGNYTVLTGSLMTGEVMNAINLASKKYAMLDDVQDRVGERIAALCRAEGAMVTAGCWSALVLGMAGVLTGKNAELVSKLPFVEGTGMKSEVILQKSHAVGYEHALTHAGATLIKVESTAELEQAINSKTAMLWFLNREAAKGKIQHQEFVELSRKHNLPCMIDIAADVPPVENLWKYNEMGFDLVAISGGKALCGPQSAGVLMGKKPLIEAARLNANPRSGVGRGQKVNKEEIIGMYVAIKEYVARDHKKEWQQWEAKVATINKAISDIPGVSTEVYVPPVDNHNPSLRITWDPVKINLTSEQLRDKLRSGEPSIEVISWEKENSIRITVFMLQPREEKIVAERLRYALTNV